MAPCLTGKSWHNTLDFYATEAADPTMRKIARLFRDVLAITDDPKVADFMDREAAHILNRGWADG